jgi:two-component system sensor histidine kinase VicK
MVGSLDNVGPAIHVIYEPIWAGLVQLKEKGVKIRVVTDATPDNITYCKKLMEVCELRHLDGVRTNFAIADGKVALLHGVSQETNPLSQAIITSVKALVEAQMYLFDNLWKNAIPAQYKIKEIEEGVMPPFRETIMDSIEIQKLVFDLVTSAKQEILMLLFPIIQLLEAAVQNRVNDRILAFKDTERQLEKLIALQKMMVKSEEAREQPNSRELMGIEKKAKIEFHIIDTFKQQERRVLPKVSILIVDSKVSLVEELKGSKNNHSNGALTLATYSNSD